MPEPVRGRTWLTEEAAHSPRAGSGTGKEPGGWCGQSLPGRLGGGSGAHTQTARLDLPPVLPPGDGCAHHVAQTLVWVPWTQLAHGEAGPCPPVFRRVRGVSPGAGVGSGQLGFLREALFGRAGTGPWGR